MAAFRSCPEILCRPESPEVILCSLSRDAPSPPAPALAPGPSPPVRRGGGRGGVVAAVCAPVFLCAGVVALVAPGQRRQHTGTGAAAQATKATGLCNPFQKKETLESLHKTVAFVAVNPGPARLGTALARPRPRLPCPRVLELWVVALPLFLCVARSCLKRSWGRRAQPGGGWPAHRVATGAPARLLGWPLMRRAWWPVAAFPGSPVHRDSTGTGNGSNGPPQPSPKKRNTGEACGNTLPPLPCGCRCCLRPACCLRSCGVSLPPCRAAAGCCPCRAASRSRRRCCCPAAHAAAVAGGEVANFKMTGRS